MSNEINQTSPLQQRFAEVFARLHDQDIEQFYAHYQLWVLRQRVPFLEKQIETLQGHIAENQRQIEQLQPPAIALAVLARLQSNGVKDIALLDQMLERGEDWLDRMMQRLDYCEQVEDFIQGDYTQWCVNSLEGAYDWIDSLRDAPSAESSPSQAVEQPAEADIQATEELLLQKLSTDDEEAMLEVTLKRPAIQSTQTIESTAEEVAEAPADEQQTEPVAEAESKEETIGDNEPQAATTSELQAEMSGWQDLESPEEPSEPWYSVSLEKGAAPQGEHAQAMNDWIKILQAESPAPEEINEAAALPAENEEEQAEVSAEEQAEPEAVPSEEQAPAAENEPEVISESEEVPAPEENEVVAAEVVEVESEPEQGDVSASEAMPVENPAVEEECSAENEAAEATAGAQAEPAEAEGATYILSSKVAEGELIDAAKAIEFLSIAEEPVAEIEELEAVEPGSGEAEQAADVESPEETEVHVEEEIAPTTAAEAAEEDAQAQEAEPSIAAVEQEEMEAQAVEETPEETEEAEPQGGQETHPFREEEGQEQEEQEISSPQAEEAQEQEMSPITNVVEEGQKEAPSLISVEEGQETAPIAGEEEQKANLVEESEAEKQSPEVEEAAIANDILGPEGEQLAWYEYLELDEQGSPSPSGLGEERIEPEERPLSDEAEPSEGAAEMPELHEFVVAIEGEQAPSPEETARREEPTQIEEEQIEIEGWQTWGTQQEDDDKTLPMPLKEIAQEQDLPANAEPEPPAATFEVMEQANVNEGNELSGPVANPGEPLSEAAAGEIIVLDRQAAPVAPPARVEERPKKRGFWQRLFGRKHRE